MTARPGPAVVTARPGPPAGLPTALARWSSQLAVLDPGTALALGPMVRRLDELVGRHSAADAHDGEPDGFDGLTRRGHPERMLVSQWLLAQEVPEEFVRRAAVGELLHLAPARRHGEQHGSTVLLLDCGPYQHGSPRLLQLALALVLHRRAEASGRALRIGVLGHAPDRWLDGDLSAALQQWLAARSVTAVKPDDVEARLAELDQVQDAWLVTGSDLAARVRAGEGTGGWSGVGPRLVTIEESDWTSSGPSALVVMLAGERVHLPLPEPDAAVRVLRGHGWRRRESAATAGATAGAGSGVAGGGVAGGAERVHAPALPGHQPVLVARGDRPGRLVVQRLQLGPDEGRRGVGRARRHDFDGTVMAASGMGRRLVVLVAASGRLTARVIGKNLGAVAGIAVPLWAVGLTGSDVESAAHRPPAELFFEDGELVACLAGRWVRLGRDGDGGDTYSRVAMVATAVTDAPIVFSRWGKHLSVHGRSGSARYEVDENDDRLPVVGGGVFGWRSGPSTWRIAPLPTAAAAGDLARLAVVLGDDTWVRVPAQATVIGAAVLAGVPGVLALDGAGSGSGIGDLVFASTDGTRPLPVWSGATAVPAVHAHLPLVAVQRPDGAVEVGRLDTGEVLARLDGTT